MTRTPEAPASRQGRASPTDARLVGSAGLLSVLFFGLAVPDTIRGQDTLPAAEPPAADTAPPDSTALAAATDPVLRLEPSTFNGLRARPLGPAVMGGRISALAGVSGEGGALWVGAAGGGVWKSEDGGVTFESVFDEHPQSIGAVAVDPSAPETVWIGTGESWTRNSVSVGKGVYRTTDGGETWERLGLEASERIARIVVDPTDGSRVFVCATGPLWNAGGARGVYRTTDAGGSWTRVLEVDEDTGCSDLAVDPQEPDVLYAGMWQFRRWPWFFASGGPGSGLYRSRDGGESWEELTTGLPAGEKGRIAVAVAPSRPSTVYALVEAERTALYRSDDLGGSWTEVNASTNIQARPFYFARVVVDPADHRRVYKPGLTLGASADGGESFTSPFSGALGGGVHSDHHALWVDPGDPRHLVLGTDGGVYVSRDRGSHWRLVGTLPVSQFYQVSLDDAWPYHVYGGLQDNGTWTGPVRGRSGIRAADWVNIGYGDGFHAYVDPTDPDVVLVEYQGGNLLRYRKSTGEHREIRPYAAEGETELRFNWNTALHPSAAEPGVFYLGAQYLFRTDDRGDSWVRLSPDLTTDDPEKQRQEESGGLTTDNSSAENHTTIFTIADSPLDGDVIWVGTDDGNLQVTRDGGEGWTNVADRVPGIPPGTWVSHVAASPHAAGTAFATFDGHRLGDMATYVARTRDHGESWESLVTPELEGYAHVIAQDPVNPDLLYLGTEFGLWISADAGRSWTRFESDLPPQVSVRDLDVHPRDADLVVATHGRGLYVVDDVTPLRHLTPEVVEAEAALLPTRPAPLVLNTTVQAFPGDGEYVAPDPPEAASIVYHLRRRHLFGDLKVEIYDENGAVVSTLTGGKEKGLNRAEWPMRLDPPKLPAATSLVPIPGGPRLAEGSYRVRLVKGDTAYEGRVRLVPDPRNPHPPEDRRLQHETAMTLYHALERLAYVGDATAALRDSARARTDVLGRDSGGGRRVAAFADRLEEFRASLVSTSETGYMAGDEKLREELASLYAGVVGYSGRPTRSQLARAEGLEARLREAEETFDRLTGEPLRRVNRVLRDAGMPELSVLSREPRDRR